jgi:Spy/CpxP family protein refolding chaperone
VAEDVKARRVKTLGGGNMKSKYFKILAVVLAVAVISAVALSQTVRRTHMRGDGMFGGAMFGGGPMMGILSHRLDLSDAQRAQAKEIWAKEKPTIQPLMLQMAQGHSQLRQMVMSGAFDEAKAREVAVQQTQAMTEFTVQRARIDSELFQILTPEQKTKLGSLVSQQEQRFMNPMQGQAKGQTQTQQ